MERDVLIARVRKMAPWAQGGASPIRGGRDAAVARLRTLDVATYGKTRNATDGAVLRISPYVRHGVIGLHELRDAAWDDGQWPERFVQQLAWRDYFQRLYRAEPETLWQSREPLKTGWGESDYADELPDDIAAGDTGEAAMDGFIAELVGTGWLHNHARLYLAAYVVHWRRVSWQTGARWFLSHLLDGDPASNNYSWQWVASTFSNKPYYFNLDNLQSFAGNTVDTAYARNKAFAGSYEDLRERLFPRAEGSW